MDRGRGRWEWKEIRMEGEREEREGGREGVIAIIVEYRKVRRFKF